MSVCSFPKSVLGPTEAAGKITLMWELRGALVEASGFRVSANEREGGQHNVSFIGFHIKMLKYQCTTLKACRYIYTASVLATVTGNANCVEELGLHPGFRRRAPPIWVVPSA